MITDYGYRSRFIDYGYRLQLPITISDDAYRSRLPIAVSDYGYPSPLPIAVADYEKRDQLSSAEHYVSGTGYRHSVHVS